MVFKMLHVALIAAIKFAFTLPYALLIGLEWKYALIALLFGGIGGFLFFFYFSRVILQLWRWSGKEICRTIYIRILRRSEYRCQEESDKRRFTQKNRFLVRARNKYGYWGLVVGTPVFFTIPLGAFLLGKYYAHRRYVVWTMIGSITGWSVVLSVVVYLLPGLLVR